MKVRFIEYDGEIMVVVGIAYDTKFDPPECYVAVPLKDSIVRSLFNLHTVTIPFDWAVEVSDKTRIKTLLVLYGR